MSFLVSCPHTWVCVILVGGVFLCVFLGSSTETESQEWVEFYVFLFLKHFPGVPDEAR